MVDLMPRRLQSRPIDPRRRIRVPGGSETDGPEAGTGKGRGWRTTVVSHGQHADVRHPLPDSLVSLSSLSESTDASP